MHWLSCHCGGSSTPRESRWYTPCSRNRSSCTSRLFARGRFVGNTKDESECMILTLQLAQMTNLCIDRLKSSNALQSCSAGSTAVLVSLAGSAPAGGTMASVRSSSDDTQLAANTASVLTTCVAAESDTSFSILSTAASALSNVSCWLDCLMLSLYCRCSSARNSRCSAVSCSRCRRSRR